MKNQIGAMTDSDLAADIAATELKLELKRRAYRRTQAQIAAVLKHQSAIKKEQISRLVASSDSTPWAELLEFTPCESNYEYLAAAVKKLCPRSTCGITPLSVCGYNSATMQWAIRLYMSNESAPALREIEAHLSELLVHIRALNGEKLVGILEPSLSEHGSYQLFEISGAWELRITVYGRTSVVAKFASTAEMLEYVQLNCNMDRQSLGDQDDE